MIYLFLLLSFTGFPRLAYGQFPSYFFSSQNNLSPPRCICQSATYTPTNPNLSNYPNQLYNPNNPGYPSNPSVNSNFPQNSNQPFNPNYPSFPGTNLNQQYNANVPSGNQQTGFATNYRICGTDGNVYTDVCQIINAQYSNPNLGGRPCDMAAAVQAGQSGGASMQDDGGPVCLNTGLASPSATLALGAMYTSTVTGIRCQGSCPCPLSCPPPPGSRRGSHHGDSFNHWSFHRGSRGYGQRPG